MGTYQTGLVNENDLCFEGRVPHGLTCAGRGCPPTPTCFPDQEELPPWDAPGCRRFFPGPAALCFEGRVPHGLTEVFGLHREEIDALWDGQCNHVVWNDREYVLTTDYIRGNPQLPKCTVMCLYRLQIMNAVVARAAAVLQRPPVFLYSKGQETFSADGEHTQCYQLAAFFPVEASSYAYAFQSPGRGTTVCSVPPDCRTSVSDIPGKLPGTSRTSRLLRTRGCGQRDRRS